MIQLKPEKVRATVMTLTSHSRVCVHLVATGRRGPKDGGVYLRNL